MRKTEFLLRWIILLSGLPFWCSSKKPWPSGACASITNTEIIALTERFYYQEMMILASEKKFPYVTLRKRQKKTIFTFVGKKFLSPSLVNFLLCTHPLQLFRAFTPTPSILDPSRGYLSAWDFGTRKFFSKTCIYWS